LLLAEQATQNSVDPVWKAEQLAQSKRQAHLFPRIAHLGIARQGRIARHEREAAPDAVYGSPRHIWTTSKQDWAGAVSCHAPSLLGYWELKRQARSNPTDRALLVFRAAADPEGNYSPTAHLLVPLPAATDGERVQSGSF
jgi:hypothetical protein